LPISEIGLKIIFYDDYSVSSWTYPAKST
jgi:hypothetical protein